jgi:Mrp family chromosome partitioning ATPase
MELADLGFAVRRFWLLVVAVPAVAVATALLLAYAPATQYDATSSVLFQPASADVDLRLVQFVLPSVPLEVGTTAFQEAVRDSLLEEAADADWTLSAVTDTTSGVVWLSASGLNPDVLPDVANAAADELISRRKTSQLNIEVLQPAEASVAEAPRRAPILFGAAVLGGIVGIFAAVVAAHLKPRFRRPKDVADRFGLRLLGEVPRVRQSRLDPTKVVDDPALGEFFKRLRLNIDAGKPPSGLAVVSYSDGDGKSTVTANLACVPVRKEAKVAVVDADLKQPSLERYFGVEAASPMSDGSLFYVQPLELPTEDGSTRSLTLVSPFATTTSLDTLARGLPAVLRALEDEAVIVDTPSLARSADALEAARITGRALLVVDIEKQTPDQVQEAVRLLLEAGVEISGVVVNRTSRDIEPGPVKRVEEPTRIRRPARRGSQRASNRLARRSASRTQGD